jgi:hypothetical protein
MRTLLAACLLTAGLFASTERAAAQFNPAQPYNPYYRPPISPYLNMNRPGNPAINYYGQIRPQFDTSKQLQMLQQQQARMMQMGIPPEEEALTGYSITGHPTTFSNYGHYFGQTGGGGTFGGQPVTGPTVSPLIYGKR